MAGVRLHDRAGAVDDVVDQFGLGRAEVQVRGQSARRTDARGTVRVGHGVLLGFGEQAERVRIGWGHGVRCGLGHRDLAEPVAGALHRGRVQRGQLLLARRLHAQQRAQRRVRLARHGRGLGTAAVHLGGVGGGEAGRAQAVGRVGIHADDPRGQPGLEGVGGVEGGDGVHCAPFAGSAGVGGVVGGWGEHGADEGVDFAVVGAGGSERRWCGLHEVAPGDGGKGWM